MMLLLCFDGAKIQFESNSQQDEINTNYNVCCVLTVLRYNLKAIHNRISLQNILQTAVF